MRLPALTLSRRWPGLCAAACLALLASLAHARALPGGVELGMNAQQLQEAVPALTPHRHPVRLAGGLVGSWSGPAIEVEGIALTPTFYLAEAQLRRIEYLAPPDAGPEAFEALLRWGRVAWGREMASDGPEGAYATWSDDVVDAYLQRSGPAQRPQVRLVIKLRVLKDGSQL